MTVPARRISEPATGRSGTSWRLRAALALLVCFIAATLALELAVLAVDIGPLDLATGGAVAASAIVAIGAGRAFWRLAAVRAERPRLAAALLIVALGWAGLGALVMAWLFAQFNP